MLAHYVPARNEMHPSIPPLLSLARHNGHVRATRPNPRSARFQISQSPSTAHCSPRWTLVVPWKPPGRLSAAFCAVYRYRYRYRYARTRHVRSRCSRGPTDSTASQPHDTGQPLARVAEWRRRRGSQRPYSCCLAPGPTILPLMI